MAEHWNSPLRRQRAARASLGMRAAVLLLAACSCARAFRVEQTWDERPWCESISQPLWPFALSKQAGQTSEPKGHVASNEQNFGEQCSAFGTLGKCNICSAFACGTDLASTCSMQLQGLPHAQLASNVPTASDAPYAVGASHRYDFGAASRVCTSLSDGDCLLHDAADYSGCQQRCWGSGYPQPEPTETGWRYSNLVGTPQGRVGTAAGVSGIAGHRDGAAEQALFNNPTGVAVARDGTVFIADNENHAIRALSPAGVVSTLAGSTEGEAGSADGIGTAARFTHPTDVTVYYDWRAGGVLVLFVADTDNHRIRRIDVATGAVTCFAGRCGQPPSSGYADGSAEDARFSHPAGVVANGGGTLFVADTFNHVVRSIAHNGTVSTLAGETTTAETTPGCPEPCLRGVPGYRDLNLTTSRFQFPHYISLGPEETVIVVDGNRVRRITQPGKETTIQAITSLNRVTTIAGALAEGADDGEGGQARFNSPFGVVMAADGHVYVADGITCRIRRVAPAALVADDVACDTPAVAVMRPAGCSSYDAEIDSLGRMATPVRGSHHFNQLSDRDGHVEPPCHGTVPVRSSLSYTGASLGPLLGTATETVTVEESTDAGTVIKVDCPAGCMADDPDWLLFGDGSYTDDSSICHAALHAGVIDNSGGLVALTVTGELPSFDAVLANGVQSAAAGRRSRSFTLAAYNVSEVQVETIAGAPAAPLDAPCGAVDAQPPQAARFSLPSGVALFVNESLSATTPLFIADRSNHVLRFMTAVCSQVCENGGNCTAPNHCTCATGWGGVDCTLPQCDAGCPARHLCTGPNLCTCVPGYQGAACDVPQCVQTCEHGGSCTAPDSCTCAPGWTDANCTTPVCTQTCGNQANCTAPDVCSCHSGWEGADCRTPICEQPCSNGGVCVAPDSCMCAADWSGYDCSVPICSQGFLQLAPLPPDDTDSWLQYLPCNAEAWCNATQEIDCQQQARTPQLQAAPTARGAGVAAIGDDVPAHCVLLELSASVVAPYQLLLGSDGSYSPRVRRSSPSPYELSASSDRQLALVEVRRVPQGGYACANGGVCTAPHTCVCQPGWLGFDCRVPVCSQGYYADGLWSDRYAGQGGYRCSLAARTEWENTDYLHGHPNYHSAYQTQAYSKSEPLGYATNRGYLRDGIWSLVDGATYELGDCDVLFRRNCNVPAFEARLDGGADDAAVTDPDTTYRARISRDDSKTTAVGFWTGPDVVCVDHVLRGCFNNGTCVAPGQCECQPGWRGSDCSIPECTQGELDTSCGAEGCFRCANGGNCTLPQQCTCELGWSGENCTIALCAQECRNGGVCSAPDHCDCVRTPSTWRDGRVGARPVFRKDNGDPQDTGWTGYDCSTPICTQAESFVLLDAEGSVQLESTRNDGATQSGCDSSRTVSSEQLCRQLQWAELQPNGTDIIRVNHELYEEVEEELWLRRTQPAGEGIYACYNHGSCVAPDQCVCADGWSGFDCNIPLCRHRQSSGALVSCLRGGECVDRDTCSCIQLPSILHRIFDEAPEGTTGWDGTDCSIPMCVQGTFDPTCRGSFAPGGEGCFRCPNGGNCTAPDFCTCPPEWTGFDCSTPVCTLEADARTIEELHTVDFARVEAFEQDPCGEAAGNGNCSSPDTCLCKCTLPGEPWQDPFNRAIPDGFTRGRGTCQSGFEGNVGADGSYTSCHLQIYEASQWERSTLLTLIMSLIACFVLCFFACICRLRLKRRRDRNRYQRRRSRRSSEQSGGAYGH